MGNKFSEEDRCYEAYGETYLETSDAAAFIRRKAESLKVYVKQKRNTLFFSH
jgi:hypothetical protein